VRYRKSLGAATPATSSVAQETYNIHIHGKTNGRDVNEPNKVFLPKTSGEIPFVPVISLS
jgi:hypothetical protein